MGIEDAEGDADSISVGTELGTDEGEAVGPTGASVTSYETHSGVRTARRRRPLRSSSTASSIISSAATRRPSRSQIHFVRTMTIDLHVPTAFRPAMVQLYCREPSSSPASKVPSSRTRSPKGSSVMKMTALITSVRPLYLRVRPLYLRPVARPGDLAAAGRKRAGLLNRPSRLVRALKFRLLRSSLSFIMSWFSSSILASLKADNLRPAGRFTVTRKVALDPTTIDAAPSVGGLVTMDNGDRKNVLADAPRRFLVLAVAVLSASASNCCTVAKVRMFCRPRRLVVAAAGRYRRSFSEPASCRAATDCQDTARKARIRPAERTIWL